MTVNTLINALIKLDPKAEICVANEEDVEVFELVRVSDDDGEYTIEFRGE